MRIHVETKTPLEQRMTVMLGCLWYGGDGGDAPRRTASGPQIYTGQKKNPWFLRLLVEVTVSHHSLGSLLKQLQDSIAGWYLDRINI